MNEEYKILREEIMYNSKRVYLYFALIVLILILNSGFRK